MILFYDNFIANGPLWPKPELEAIEREAHQGCWAYRKQHRVDVAKYTLASYAEYPWSHVLIKYEVEDKGREAEFGAYARELFPAAEIHLGRSDSQEKYRDAIERMDSWNDEWIFYAPNSDHPFIRHEFDTLTQLEARATSLISRYGTHLTIYYSHFPELVNASSRGHIVHSKNFETLEADELCEVVRIAGSDLTAIQVLHRDLFRKWFLGFDLGERRVIRSESIADLDHPDQVSLIPQVEIARHYDGYAHTMVDRGEAAFLPFDKVPPLFIPDGFFEGEIRIRYGYDSYREGWVNVNPTADKYSFRDQIHGADLKIGRDQLPLFWQGRTAEVNCNRDLDLQSEGLSIHAQEELLRDPWSDIGRLRILRHQILWRILRHQILCLPVRWARTLIRRALEKWFSK